jgi:predicted amidohydrolase
MRPYLAVAVVQSSAGRDVSANLARIERLLEKIKACDLIALPECFALRGSDADLREGAEPVPGPTTERLASWARGRGAWVLAGSVAERDGGGVYNTSVLLDRGGRIAATYRKIHLFEARLEDCRLIREADVFESGRAPALCEVEGWSCGMSVCYDLRFPELYRLYSERGAHVLLAPSNFTQRTGRDHWEVLVRARAIENQCFVVAPDQCGANPATGVESHGQSMVVGPWGEVICEAGAEETVLVARLEARALEETRRRVPVLAHRRLGAEGGGPQAARGKSPDIGRVSS